MNDDQNKQNSAAPASGEGANKRRNRHRHHRGGGKHQNGENRQNTQQNTAPQQNAAAPANAAQTAANNAGKQNGGKSRRNRHRGGRGRHDQKRDGENLRQNTAEAASLEELRAQIVLQSADGTKPTVEKQPLSAKLETVAQPLADTNELDDVPLTENFSLDSIPTVFTSRQIPPEDRIEIIGVRFRSSGKVYFFDPKGKTVRQGDFVVVDTARGPEFGEIAFQNRMISKKDLQSPLRGLIRLATKEDIDVNAENRTREKEAAEIFRKKVKEHNLQMKLIDVQFTFDNSKLLFYFTSEGRVDFRDLVKDLAGVFHTRIELRQIGIRDEAKLLGGLGACGRPLCCASFLSDFVQVSIKMAKEQGLSLNSAKISGTCGRLMCCLRYETESYAEELKLTPPVGSTVKTADGTGDVVANNPIAGTVRVFLKESEAFKQYKREDVTVLSRGKQPANDDLDDETADFQNTEKESDAK